MDKHEDRKVIGRREIADFPALNLNGVRLKIDTGAYSSAIHCSSFEVDSSGVLSVIFLCPDEEGYTGKTIEFTEFDRRNVKLERPYRNPLCDKHKDLLWVKEI